MQAECQAAVSCMLRSCNGTLQGRHAAHTKGRCATDNRNSDFVYMQARTCTDEANSSGLLDFSGHYSQLQTPPAATACHLETSQTTTLLDCTAT